LAMVLCAAMSVAAQGADVEEFVTAQGAPIPANSSWQQVHYARIHASCMATGSLVLLPLGAIAARYLRAYLPFQKWLSVHVTTQLILALPIICVGFGFGVHVAMYNGQFKNPHTRMGLSLFLMYWIQLALGILTASTPSVPLGSYSGPKNQPDTRHPIRARPWYALLHVFWGISMIIIAAVQVRRGYTIEWPAKRGQPASESVNRAWKAWVVIIPVVYLAGLALLLRRQWSQERARMVNVDATPATNQYASVKTSDA